jgi:hypothetical protein
VHVGGEGVDHLLDVLGEPGTRVPLRSEVLDLLERGDLSGEQQPEEGLGSWLGGSWCLGQSFLTLRDGKATEANTLARELLTFFVGTSSASKREVSVTNPLIPLIPW